MIAIPSGWPELTPSLKGMKHPAQGWSDESDLPWVEVPEEKTTLKALEQLGDDLGRDDRPVIQPLQG
jgi:hypothetical protein